jgi:hypothetical protein
VMVEGAEFSTGFGRKLAAPLRQFVSDVGLRRAIHRLAASVGTEFRFQRDSDVMALRSTVSSGSKLAFSLTPSLE